MKMAKIMSGCNSRQAISGFSPGPNHGCCPYDNLYAPCMSMIIFDPPMVFPRSIGRRIAFNGTGFLGQLCVRSVIRIE